MEPKIWGMTDLIHESSGVEIHRIVGSRGGFCSIHKHDTKFNKFYIEHGSLSIHIWDGSLQSDPLIVDLYGGQHTTIRPGVYHQFHVLEEDTVAYEIYWVELSPNDIIRHSKGGKKNNDQSEV